MAHLRIRWPVLSFLELFCCAFGGAAILLLLINREIRGTTQTTRMLRITVEATFPNDGPTKIDVTARRLPLVTWPDTEFDPNDGLWIDGEPSGYRDESAAPSRTKVLQKDPSEHGRVTAFLCDPRASPGDDYELVIRGPPGGIKADAAEVKAILEQLQQASAASLPRRDPPWRVTAHAALTRELFKALADPGSQPLAALHARWHAAFDRAPGFGPNDATTAKDDALRECGKLTDTREFLEALRLLVAVRLADPNVWQNPKARVEVLQRELDATEYFKRSPKPEVVRNLLNDLRVHLALQIPREAHPNRVWIAGELLPKRWDDGPGFGTSYAPSNVYTIPPGSKPAVVLRAGDHTWPDLKGAVGAIRRGTITASNLGAAWFDTAERLLKPRDVRVTIAWGSDERVVLNLEAGGLLDWSVGPDGRTEIRLNVRVFADGTVRVNGAEFAPP